MEYKVYVFQVGPTAPDTPYASIAHVRQPDLSPDGQQLLVNGTGGGHEAITLMTSRGENPRHATCPAITVESALPTWSPDGQALAFDGNQVDYNFRRIYYHTINPEPDCELLDNRLTVLGGDVQDDNGLHPVWGGDNWLYFRSCATWKSGGAGECGVWSRQMDGDGFRKITDNFQHIPLDANHGRLLFMSQESGNWDIYTVSNTGNETPLNLTKNPHVDVWGAISPDGQSFAFLSDRDGGQWAIWIANIDGSNPRLWLRMRPLEWGDVVVDHIYAERLSWSR